LAERFLKEREMRIEGVLHLRWWRDEFYRFNGTHYVRLADGDLRAHVNEWLQGDPVLRSTAGTHVTLSILQNLQAITLIDAAKEPPCWLDETENTCELVSLSNGVISIDDLLATKLDGIRPHSPAYFTLASLPFPLDPNADCPRWLSFIDEMMPDPDVRSLLQTMFGYLLVYDTTQEVFFLLEGAGANGKTVVCTVLREILGPSNTSAVGLEAFSAVRTFPLVATIGKKANIVEELEEVSRAAEGVLKNFVTGKPMTIERKHKDSFDLTPTARLVFATNVLPRFVDRSDGIWRRMILIPFRQQILERSKQDKRLIDPHWWRSSGELPGIFLWALGGLAELRRRGCFVEPELCRAEKETYRQESNPAGTFLAEMCEVGSSLDVSSRVLYQGYNSWVVDNGFRALSATQFAKEVKRLYPEVQLSAHPRYIDGGRFRVWTGLRFHGGRRDT